MKRTRDGGFILIMVVALMPLIAMALVVLSTGLKTLMLESSRAGIEAQSRDLAASALAWARLNAKDMSRQEGSFTVQLDTSALAMDRSICHVTVTRFEDGSAEVLVSTTCKLGGRQLKRDVRARLGGSGFGETTETLP